MMRHCSNMKIQYPNEAQLPTQQYSLIYNFTCIYQPTTSKHKLRLYSYQNINNLKPSSFSFLFIHLFRDLLSCLPPPSVFEIFYYLLVQPTFFGKLDLPQFLRYRLAIRFILYSGLQLIRSSSLYFPSHPEFLQYTCQIRPGHRLSTSNISYFFVQLLQLDLSQLFIHKFQPNISFLHHIQQIFLGLQKRNQLFLIFGLFVFGQLGLDLRVQLCNICVFLIDKKLNLISRLLQFHLDNIYTFNLSLYLPILRYFLRLRLFLFIQADPHGFLCFQLILQFIYIWVGLVLYIQLDISSCC